jgi:hypothetical protein
MYATAAYLRSARVRITSTGWEPERRAAVWWWRRRLVHVEVLCKSRAVFRICATSGP